MALDGFKCLLRAFDVLFVGVPFGCFFSKTFVVDGLIGHGVGWLRSIARNLVVSPTVDMGWGWWGERLRGNHLVEWVHSAMAMCGF